MPAHPPSQYYGPPLGPPMVYGGVGESRGGEHLKGDLANEQREQDSVPLSPISLRNSPPRLLMLLLQHGSLLLIPTLCMGRTPLTSGCWGLEPLITRKKQFLESCSSCYAMKSNPQRGEQ